MWFSYRCLIFCICDWFTVYIVYIIFFPEEVLCPSNMLSKILPLYFCFNQGRILSKMEMHYLCLLSTLWLASTLPISLFLSEKLGQSKFNPSPLKAAVSHERIQPVLTHFLPFLPPLSLFLSLPPPLQLFSVHLLYSTLPLCITHVHCSWGYALLHCFSSFMC